MPYNLEVDSGRSSCSATSVGLPSVHFDSYDLIRNKKEKDQHFNNNLTISSCPRSYSSLIKSPDIHEPFPSCRIKKNNRKPISDLFEATKVGRLKNAQSNYEIVSSTKIEEPNLLTNASSMNVVTSDQMKRKIGESANFRRTRPVQRAASRLYKAEYSCKGENKCIGPEFIVRASQPSKNLDLSINSTADKRVINVILLNGQKVDVLCDPNTVTAGQLFEALVLNEKYDNTFMLGIAVLLSGDFVFLPDDYKIKKVAPENWCMKSAKTNLNTRDLSVTVFLRIKFFLPTNVARNIQDGEWRYRVYLQLRRSTIEGQLVSTIQNLVLLSGYALHIEFGEYSYRQHGSADYFLLEHYLPENYITNNMADIKLQMKKAHESRKGLDKATAIVNYITLAQTLRDYGCHFYSAIWATRDGFCRDVWLSIGPKGVTLYSRNNIVYGDRHYLMDRTVLQSLPWHHIHTFLYNKKSIYIVPNAYSNRSRTGAKYKLKMADNKSFFVFCLISLHHRLYMKLYAEDDFLSHISNETNCYLDKEIPIAEECSNYQDSYNLAVRNRYRVKRVPRRKFKVNLFDKNTQNKENSKPNTEELLRNILLMQNESLANIQDNSINEAVSSSECSSPRRCGVKMGTKVFSGIKSPSSSKCTSPFKLSPDNNNKGNITQSDSDDLDSVQRHCNIDKMNLLPERSYHKFAETQTAFVLESPKVYPDAFVYNDASESCLNTSLLQKLDNMGCVQGDRVFVTAIIERDNGGTLGLQVAEGSDGNVYIKSITPDGPAWSSKKLLPGDQIISVNGHTLLNVKYDKALAMLQAAPQKVELIVLQNVNRSNIYNCKLHIADSEAKDTVLEIPDCDVDDNIINEEALKTIHTLIKLTKDNFDTKSRSYRSNYSYPETFSEDIDNKEKLLNCKNSKNFLHRPLSLCMPKEIDRDISQYLSDVDLSKESSLKSVKAQLDNLEVGKSAKNIALPRNYGLSRKWLGPVRYPVTPCKNGITESAIINRRVIRKHYVYGGENSDDDQIYL